jgi:hypothetical protein
MKHRIQLVGAACAALAFVFAAVPAQADGLDDEPLARFEDPLCPGVIGLPADRAVIVVARIRENAGRLGLRLADEERCNANLIVSVLLDGRDYLGQLSRSNGYLFAGMDRSRREDLLAQAGPARTWVTTHTRSRDGMHMSRREGLHEPPEVTMWGAHSLIYVPTRQEITVSMVLVDRAAVDGISLAQLADYATLHGLADFVPPAAEGVASMQQLFTTSGNGRPAGLTEFDLAYLTRLYSSIPNLPAATRLAGLEGMAD